MLKPRNTLQTAPQPDLAVARHMLLVEDSKIAAIADLARHDPSVNKLWVGEPDLKTPDFISDAAVAALRDGHTNYTYSRGIPALHDALVAYYRRHWGVELSSGCFSATVGGMNAIMQSLQMMVGRGDEVIYASPAWPNLVQAIRVVGATAVPVGFIPSPDGRFALDLERLFKAVTPRTRAIVINSPSNPTGWVMPLEQMIAVRDFARRRGLWILSDEVYNHYHYTEGVAPSFLQIAEPEDRLVVTSTFSKNWAMTGWRMGWVVFPEVYARIFAKLSQYNTTGVATFLQHGAIAALDNGDGFIRQMVARSRESGQILSSRLSEIFQREVPMPEGSFYLLANVGENLSGQAFAENLLRGGRVGTAPGPAFGQEGEHFIRLCFAIAPALANEAADRIEAYVRR